MAHTQAYFPFPTHNALSLQRGSKMKMKMKMKMQVVVRATANKTKLNVGVETVPDETTLVQTTPNTLTYESGFLGVASSHRTTSPLNLSPAVPYLKKILTSKVYDVAIETPLDFAPKLSHKMGANIWLKREDLQPEVFSFKVRGAYNMMANLSTEQLRRGVVCSSSSNHALGVAFAAAKLNCRSLVVMPATTPESKWRAVESLGARVILIGDTYHESEFYAKLRCQEEGLVFIPSCDHPDVIAGQGTIGMEILHQMKSSLHAVFVPIGSGGLAAGVSSYIKCVMPEVLIIGVEPSDANAMALSLHHDKRVFLKHVGVFADGVATNFVGEEAFSLCKEFLDGVVFVSRDSICASMKDMFEEKRSILEPAGALALAGAKAYCNYYDIKDETMVVVTTGANMNFGKLQLVTELADVGARREAVLATFNPEKPGSLKKLCQLVGSINITEIRYRYDAEDGNSIVLYSVGYHKEVDFRAMEDRLEHAGLQTLNLTENDLATDHLRYLMGGRACIKNEKFIRFVFPEKPGALMKFLDTFSPKWNITLFHYRAQGEMGANVLIGMQVAQCDRKEFAECVCNLGYEYEDEDQNEALNLLMA